jgi:type I restriction enzyme S subunit
MKKANNIPELRFHSFNDSWVTKAGELVFKTISNKNHNSDLPILAITQEYGAIPRDLIDFNISVSEKSIESYKVVEEGDFIISLRSFQGGIEFSKYRGICSPAYIILRPTVEIDNDFFKYYLKTPRYIKRLTKNIEGIRDGKMISFKYFSDAQLTFPSIPEQKRISNLFLVVDKKLMELKKKKYLFEKYKKGILQNIFTKKIKFKDENGKEFPKWLKNNLGKITTKVGTKNKDNIQYPIYSISNKKGFINQSEQFDGLDSNKRGYDISLYKIVEKNTFAYNPARINVGSIGYSGNLHNIIVSSLYVCFQTTDDVNDEFLMHYFSTEQFNRAVLNSVEGGVREYLFYENFSMIGFELPSYKEQIKIASFLSKIDLKIKSIDQQIEQTEKYKLGLIQRMFI